MSIINSKNLRPRELNFKSEKLEIDPEGIGRYLLVYGFNYT